MANLASNVIVGTPLVTGGILCAPVGTALPTDETTTLNASFKPVGYITDDGLTQSEDRGSDIVTAWGGDTIASVQKDFGVNFQFSVAELLNAVAQSALYGTSNVTVTAATSSVGAKMKVAGTSAPAPHNSWIFEIANGVKRVRIVLPDAQVSDKGDTSFKNDDVAALDLTVTAYPDATGVYFYQYSNDGKPTS